jgi:molecular chaperone DnaK (HSP70)
MLSLKFWLALLFAAQINSFQYLRHNLFYNDRKIFTLMEHYCSNNLKEVSVGIDLGTTNSLISVVENGKPRIIPIDGYNMMPSVVTILPNNTIIVGHEAVRLEKRYPVNTYSSVKRIIGKTLKEVREATYVKSILKSVNKKSPESELCQLKSPIKGLRLDPETISAEILKKLLSEASNYLGGAKISKAVITIPAYFSMQQRDATEGAGTLAGLTKIKMLREPESAALAYGIKQLSQQLVLGMFIITNPDYLSFEI